MVFVEYTNEIFKIDSQNLSEIVNSTKQKFNITNFYFTLSGKIVLNNTTLKDNDILNVNLRLNGGFKKVLEKVLDPIIKPLLGMAAAVVGIVELVIELALLVPKILKALSKLVFIVVVPIPTFPDELIRSFTLTIETEVSEAPVSRANIKARSL